MNTINEKLNEMQEMLRKTNKQPMFFIGAGLSRRYLESPNWEGLLEQIAKEAKCNYDDIKKICDGENEKIAQELEYYCFRNADLENVKSKNHRLILRNYISKIFKDCCDKYEERYNYDLSEEFGKKIKEKLNDIDVICQGNESQVIREQVEKYDDIANEITVASDIRKKLLEIIELRKTIPKAIITTNYDTLLEKCIFNKGCDIHIGQESFLCGQDNSEANICDIYKIHGCITKPDSIIITKEDYDYFFNKSKYLYSKILTMFWEYPVIFIGYSISDRNIKDILTVMIEIMTEQQKEDFIKHIWIVDYVKNKEQEYVENKAIELLNGKSIEVTCFYLCYYDKFYKAVNDVVLSQNFGNLKFKISDNVIELLIKPLYQLQDKLQVVVRELLQNALDACKSKNVHAEIGIKLYQENEKNEYLQIEDNGIGMDIKIVKESFLTVGKTSKEKSEKGLVGKYGVGILSLFLIGDNVEIYTKTENGILLSFKLHIMDEKKQVNWIDKENIPEDIKNVNKPSFTIIRVHLKESIVTKDRSIDEYIQLLGLNEYLTQSQNLIRIDVNEQNHEVVKLDRDDWFIDAGDEIKIYKAGWLEIDDDELCESEKNLKKILDKKNTVLYNDMVSKAIFSVKNFKQLNGIDIPFVVLNIKNTELYENEIVTSLSRESINISGEPIMRIGNAIYELEIEEIIKILVNDKKLLEEKEIEIFDIIKHLKDKCGIIKENCDILVSNNKISLTDKYECNHIEIWSDDENLKVSTKQNLQPIKYCYVRMHKTSVAENIINDKVMGISIKYLDEYICNAQSSYYGLKKQALLIILKTIGITDHYSNTRSADLWDYIKNNKDDIRNKYNEKAKNGILWLNKNESLESELNATNSYLIVFSSSEVTKYLDSLFSKTLQKKIDENNLGEIIQII